MNRDERLEWARTATVEKWADAVAEVVMGWEKFSNGYNAYLTPWEGKVVLGADWNPDSDIGDAWKVLGKINTLRFSSRQKFLLELQKAISDDTLKSGNLVAWPDAIFHLKPRDICLAALLVAEEAEQS